MPRPPSPIYDYLYQSLGEVHCRLCGEATPLPETTRDLCKFIQNIARKHGQCLRTPDFVEQFSEGNQGDDS